MSKRTNVLLIFVKNSEKGKVKTRLASTVGDDEALEIYKKLLVYTRVIARQVNVDRQVWYSGFIPEGDKWDKQEFIKKLQHGLC